MKITPSDTHLIGKKIRPTKDWHLFACPFTIQFLGKNSFFGNWNDTIEDAVPYDENEWQLVEDEPKKQTKRFRIVGGTARDGTEFILTYEGAAIRSLILEEVPDEGD